VTHQDAIRALQKAGYRIERQGKDVVMTDAVRTVIVPRHHPIHAITMGKTVRAAGPTNDEFRLLV